MEIQLELVPIEGGGFHLLLAAGVAEEVFYLVLDTGASRTTIDHGFLQSLDLNLDFHAEDSASAGVGSIEIISYTVALPNFKLSNLKIENYEVAAIDMAQLILFYEQKIDREIKGVLGGDLLQKGKAIIDYKELKITFNENLLRSDN